jgi:hypothetical protein
MAVRTDFRRVPNSIVLGVLLLAGACGRGGPHRYDVSGRATYQGRPIPAGVIFFDPDIRKGNDGPQGYAQIKNGHYDTAQTQTGTVGGPHLVRIQGFDGKPGNELPMGAPMFREHQILADLPKRETTLDLDVPDAKSK